MTQSWSSLCSCPALGLWQNIWCWGHHRGSSLGTQRPAQPSRVITGIFPGAAEMVSQGLAWSLLPPQPLPQDTEHSWGRPQGQGQTDSQVTLQWDPGQAGQLLTTSVDGQAFQ